MRKIGDTKFEVLRQGYFILPSQRIVYDTQYVVVMPIIIAALMAFGIVRFVGMGTGNKGLYVNFAER